MRREQKVVLSDRLFSRYWDAGGVQGSIKGIKWYFFRMLRGQSYPACFSQGDALVAPLARRPRVRFVVVLNWNRKRTIVFECTSKTKVLREIYSIVVRFFLQPFGISIDSTRGEKKDRRKRRLLSKLYSCSCEPFEEIFFSRFNDRKIADKKRVHVAVTVNIDILD